MARSYRHVAAALIAAAAIALAGCSGGNSASNNSSGSSSGGTLVVDTAFSLETGDPGRNYVPTGNLILHAVYDTLLTFQAPTRALRSPTSPR